ncbi:MAG: CDP-alcohol phosphatidyltransferase family protein [Clostridia bacterium]|nr:CDP-alcohol phosphatidyltransferase family protein [Clostridia bacterium]
MRHIPNILTCIRIALVFVFIALFIKAHYLACLIVYLSAFITDVFDGFLARRFNWVSDFGKLVDPFADKLMLIAALACLCIAGKFPIYLLVVLLVKELLMIIGGLIILKKRKAAVYADIWGKVATGLFAASITLTLVNLAFNEFIPRPVLIALYIAAIGISVFSLFHYAYKGGFIGKKYRNVNAYEEKPEAE